MVWLDADLQWQAPASGRSGRPAVFNDAAIQFCLTLKCMFGLGLRQATGLAASLIKLAHLDWAVPDYSTLSRRQKTLSVAIATRRSSADLHRLIPVADTCALLGKLCCSLNAQRIKCLWQPPTSVNRRLRQARLQ